MSKKRQSRDRESTLAAKTVTTDKVRKLRPPKYRSFRMSKRLKHPVKLGSAWQLTKRTSAHLWRHKRVFAGVTLVYGLLNVILAQGLGGSDVTELKDQLEEIFVGNYAGLTSSIIVFTSLVGSAGNSSREVAGAYQLFLALIASLAVIWALRQTHAASKFRVRDAYYRGMYPLIPFVLVLLVVGIHLLPMAIGASIYSLVVANGIAILLVEKILWATVLGLLALLSLYMVASSVFALYIVTLPDMTPMKALRSARELVRYRRWTVLRKLLFLPLVLLLVAAVIMLPIIIWLTPLAKYVFFLLTMSVLVAVHGYIYSLYRELLNE